MKEATPSPRWDRVVAVLESSLAQDDPLLLAGIRPVVKKNLEDGRLARYLENNPDSGLTDYLLHVRANYVAWHETIDRLLKQSDPELGQIWYDRLSHHAVYWLVRKIGRYQPWMVDEASGYVHEAIAEALAPDFQYPHEAPFDKWMLRVVTNRCAKGARSRATGQALFEREMESLGEWNEEVLADPDAESAETRDLISHSLLPALETLSVRDRELIDLHYYENLPLQEAARRMGCSRQAAYNRHSRIKARLAELLAG